MAVTDPFDYFLERERRRQMQANPPAAAPMNIDLGVRETPAVSNIRPPEYFLNGDDAAQQSRPAIDLTQPREITQNAPAIGKEIMQRPDLTQPREEADLLYSQNVPPGGESDLLSRYSPGSTDAAPQIDLTQPREAVQPLSDVDRYRAQVTDLQQRNHPNYQDNDQGWKKRLGSILREVVIGMGNAWDQNASIADPTQRLLASAGGGVAGGFAGGFDKRIDERRRQAIDLTQARGNLAEAERQAAFDQQQALRNAQMTDWLARPELKAQEIERKTAKDEMDARIRQDKLEFDQDVSTRLQALREQKFEYEQRRDAVRAAQTQQKIDETIRANKSRESIQSTAEKGRNARANQSNNRQRLALQAKTLADELKAAIADMDDEAAARIRGELQSIRDQLGGK